MKYKICPKCEKKGLSKRSIFSLSVGRGDTWYECKYCKSQFNTQEIERRNK